MLKYILFWFAKSISDIGVYLLVLALCLLVMGLAILFAKFFDWLNRKR